MPLPKTRFDVVIAFTLFTLCHAFEFDVARYVSSQRKCETLAGSMSSNVTSITHHTYLGNRHSNASIHTEVVFTEQKFNYLIGYNLFIGSILPFLDISIVFRLAEASTTFVVTPFAIHCLFPYYLFVIRAAHILCEPNGKRYLNRYFTIHTDLTMGIGIAVILKSWDPIQAM